MNSQQFETIIRELKDPETTNQAQGQLQVFLSDPQSIFFLFQTIDNPSSPEAKSSAIGFLNRYMKKNFSLLDPTLQQHVLDKLTELSFREEPQYSIIIYPILCDYIDKDIARCNNLLGIIDNAFASNRNIVTAMSILSETITKYEDHLEDIIPFQGKFYNYSILGLQSGNWDLIIPSMEVFFYNKHINPTPNVEPHFDIIIKLGQDPNLIQNPKFDDYWRIVGQSIYKKIFPIERIGEIYNIVMSIATNEQINYELRIAPLRSLVGAVGILEPAQFSQVLDQVFMISMIYVNDQNLIPLDYFELINKSLTSLPTRDVYRMLKDRISSLLSMEDRSAHVVSIVIYSLIFDVAPDAAFTDIEEIVNNLMQALQKGDELLSEAVCIVLCQFRESIRYVDVFAPPFLPQIVPLIISPNNDLRHNANMALHTLCSLITVPLPGFFSGLWEIREQIPPNEISHYITYLATAIDKSEDFGDRESETLTNFILPFLSNPEDLDTASNFLQLVPNLASANEALIGQLIPPSIGTVMACFTSPDFIESSIVNCLFFISDFYDTFGSKYDALFRDPVDFAVKILFSDEEKGDNDDGQVEFRLSIKSAALDACCTVAQANRDSVFALRLQEKCVDFFTEKYDELDMGKESGSEEDADDDDYDDDDEDMIEENEFNAIEQGSKSSCAIIKLLNQEAAKGLFLNIFDYTMETGYQRCAAEALKPLTKCLHCAPPEEKAFYLSKCSALLNAIMSGEFKALDGKNVLTDQIDLFLMTNIAYLISEFVRYQSPLVETLCQFMIQIINSSFDSAFLYSFIGAYSDVLKYKTGSPQAVQAILELLPQLSQNAKDPDMKQNLTFLLNLLVQNDPASMPTVAQFLPALQNWYQQGKENPNGHQIMLSNIASAFLTFFANGLQLNFQLLNEAIEEFPPFDKKETAPMIQNMAKIFTVAQNMGISCVKNAALALSKLFVLNENELKSVKVPDQLMNVATQMFITFSKSNPDIIQSVLQKYQNSQFKLGKLQAILQI